MRRYYIVVFRALHLESDTFYFGSDIVPSKSRTEVIRHATIYYAQRFPSTKGWSQPEVIASRIPPAIIQQAILEASWFDQTGARRLYLAATCVYHEEKRIGRLATSHFMAANMAHAEYRLVKNMAKKYPAAEGWKLQFELEEFADIAQRHPSSEISWSYGCWNAKGC